MNVLITGAGRGLGLALARVFASRGCNIIFNSKATPAPADLPNVLARVTGDLRATKTLQALDAVCGTFGLDILINNAGVKHTSSIGETGEAEIVQTVDTNLTCAMLLTNRMWKYLAKSAQGTVVNIGSIADEMPGAAEWAYGATKAGMRAFTLGMQFDAVKSRIRAFYVRCGKMSTAMGGPAPENGELMAPEEVANIIYDLCTKPYRTIRQTEVTILRSQY